MKKYTRRHYNKKLLALGLSAFMGIGLISTGFAAWVMSKETEKSASTGINVSTITDSSANIVLDSSILKDNGNAEIAILKQSFSFDAAEGDLSGRLRGDGAQSENLKINIKGEVVGDSAITYGLSVKLELTDGIKDALQAGYIAWGGNYEFTNQQIPGTNAEEHYEVDVEILLTDDGKFNFDIEFVWGSEFYGMNPSEYFDYDFSEDENNLYDGVYDPETLKLGKDIDGDEMERIMKAFWFMITGKNSETEAEAFKDAFNDNIKIILTATAKDTVATE